ncbi:hypothetical protein JYK14_28105 [Siccirubricoccus sp. KC 17139]|uniref:Uncharacterized protein n=1 Tax=Siccirubricoccus soli TaxID=2899147 RepID=A0ABT1DDI6_9PROT|nr:hypothetical protein [Siccirubricoccus soli]MCO6419998.1 hypothetical protein [Siccirubricoccus soli]MCP2686133.1 hypothetical protein [Siccirubricoccus soli]
MAGFGCRCALGAGIGLALAGPAALLRAQPVAGAWPARSVGLVIPDAAGGRSDILAGAVEPKALRLGPADLFAAVAVLAPLPG